MFVNLYLLWLSLLISAIILIFTNQNSAVRNSERYLYPPPEYVEHFHFGFSDSIADSFWLRWIQDGDTCQTYLTPVIYNPENKELDPKVDQMGPEKSYYQRLVSIPRHKVCDNSWSFKMLDAVTKLAPKFEMPYLAGASSLAILVEDFPGASIIYERGIKEYPNNWQLLYRASFHYQFNMKDLPKASELLLLAADHGGPIWLRSLASRLYTASGQIEMGLSVLESYRKTLSEDNVEGIKAVEERIAELREKLRAAGTTQ